MTELKAFKSLVLKVLSKPKGLSQFNVRDIPVFINDVDGSLSYAKLHNLMRSLVMECYWNSDFDSVYLRILFPILDHVRQIKRLTGFENEGCWEKAIYAAETYSETTHGKAVHQSQFSIQKQIRDLMRAAKKLSAAGYKIELVDGELLVPDWNRMLLDLEKYVCFLGRNYIFNKVFHDVAYLYDDVQKRYNLSRRLSYKIDKVRPLFPLGYFLNLSVKCQYRAPFIISDFKGHAFEIFNFATDIATLLSVQPYSMFDGMFNNPESIVLFLKKNIIYDSVFAITQINPDDGRTILKGLFSELDNNKLREACNWELRDYLKVYEEVVLNQKVSDVHAPASMSKKELIDNSALSPSKIDEILEGISHVENVNKEFIDPRQMDKVLFYSRPLLMEQSGTYLLANRSWCAFSFINAFILKASQKWPSIFDALGLAAEEFLKKSFMAAGIDVLYGKYSALGIAGDCDCVIETKEVIFLLELKTSSLTMKSKSGDEFSLLRNLGIALIDAQAQLMKQEIVLREQGFIEMKVGKNVKRLELNGRQIERVNVTFEDYGYLQDRTVLKQFYSIVLNSKFSVDDPSKKEFIDDLNLKINRLNFYQSKLESISRNPTTNSFFNCWFLSVPQLLMVLKDMKNGEEFKKIMWFLRHVSFSSSDFYNEYAHALKSLKGNR